MHVVCVLLQALCIFGLNCFLAGLSDAVEASSLEEVCWGTWWLMRFCTQWLVHVVL